MKTLLIILGLLALGGGGFFVFKKIKGLRNNNAGNIRFNPRNDWKHQIGQDSDGFVIFDSPEWGIRALSILLKNYQIKGGLSTIRQIISKYAPSSENDTESYVNAVSDDMGLKPDTPILLSFNDVTIRELIKAIIKHENGINPFSDEFIDKGVALV